METKKAFTAPAASPTRSAVRTVNHTCPGLALATEAAAMADMAITLPTERSMPPVRMTSVWPRAIRAKGAAAIRMVVRLSTLVNRRLR